MELVDLGVPCDECGMEGELPDGRCPICRGDGHFVLLVLRTTQLRGLLDPSPRGGRRWYELAARRDR